MKISENQKITGSPTGPGNSLFYKKNLRYRSEGVNDVLVSGEIFSASEHGLEEERSEFLTREVA